MGSTESGTSQQHLQKRGNSEKRVSLSESLYQNKQYLLLSVRKRTFFESPSYRINYQQKLVYMYASADLWGEFSRGVQ